MLEVFLTGAEIVVGDEYKTKFWHDRWLREGILKQRFPRLFREKDVDMNMYKFTKSLWRSLVPPRVELLTWFVILEKLNTRGKLVRYGMLEGHMATCVLCNNGVENVRNMTPLWVPHTHYLAHGFVFDGRGDGKAPHAYPSKRGSWQSPTHLSKRVCKRDRYIYARTNHASFRSRWDFTFHPSLMGAQHPNWHINPSLGSDTICNMLNRMLVDIPHTHPSKCVRKEEVLTRPLGWDAFVVVVLKAPYPSQAASGRFKRGVTGCNQNIEYVTRVVLLRKRKGKCCLEFVIQPPAPKSNPLSPDPRCHRVKPAVTRFPSTCAMLPWRTMYGQGTATVLAGV
ncbi:hypothetical protein PIB30_001372 [Stylosanthes scabra]|uniref:Reverse transcriptase zinc-binding domain-containing protein n=1 Tax=Stylosanthes scabra TaxID=79078 RepID=A0ABU6Y4L6_9FABA|nr:hypothetical protein [Stylosanthes scabra]